MFNNLQVDNQGNYYQPVSDQEVQNRITFLNQDNQDHQNAIDRNTNELVTLQAGENQVLTIKGNA